MKILLLGEYSGVHTNLARALSRDHVVHTVSSGDEFKGFPRSFDIRGSGRSRVGYTANKILREIFVVLRLGRYDVVQFMTPLVFSRFGPCRLLNRRIMAKANVAVLLGAGDDPVYWRAFRRGEFRVSPCDGVLAYDSKGRVVWEMPRVSRIADDLLSRLDGVIPMAVEYDIPYRLHNKRVAKIRFPIDIGSLTYRPNRLEGDIVIYHGVQSKRKGFKGTHYIDAGIAAFQTKIRTGVRVLRTEDIPFKEYIKNVSAANVVLDQTNSYGPGMAALNAMAMGRVVLSGCKPEYLKHEGFEGRDHPLINIDPDPSQICEALYKVWQQRDRLEDHGFRSRRFVEQFHGADMIAADFMECWTRVSIAKGV